MGLLEQWYTRGSRGAALAQHLRQRGSSIGESLEDVSRVMRANDRMLYLYRRDHSVGWQEFLARYTPADRMLLNWRADVGGRP